MNSFVDHLLCRKHDEEESSGDELFDKDATSLSHVGEAVHQALGRQHHRLHHSQWNVTSGRVIGSVDQTPKIDWNATKDPGMDNDDWFPEKLADIIGRTEAFCDVMSLGPPDGKFLVAFKGALLKLAERSRTSEKPIIVRFLFGNIVGMPTNCNAVIKALTNDLPTDEDVKLHIWVGAWRRGFSWNHAKIIAVDGVYLHTGGHNLWDKHYLANNPVHDLSFELEGCVVRDGHRFANLQWAFIKSKQMTCVGSCIDSLPDYLPVVLRTRVTVSEYPIDQVGIFPPQFTKSSVAHSPHQSRIVDKSNDVPLITIGRLGSMVWSSRARPSDDAILAMINSSKRIIRLVLQDIGPVCIPGSKKALPGLVWPKTYLEAIGKAIYERGVDIEMVLSNPNSIPGGLKGTEANYGNGWSCVDVTAEIIKSIQQQYSNVIDTRLRAMIVDNLRVCFIKHGKSNKYEDGKSIGLHSKHWIVDDVCCYIGSQNLYMCDLAEWGVVVDSETEVKKIMTDYWQPMWESSYTGEDVDVKEVMDGLEVDRDGEQVFTLHATDAGQQLMPHGGGDEYYDIEKKVRGAKSVAPPSVAAAKNGENEVNDDTPMARDDKDAANAESKSEQREESGEDGNPPAVSPLISKDVTAANETSKEEKTEVDGVLSAADEKAAETPAEDDDEQKLTTVNLDCCGLAESLKITAE